MKRLSQTNPAAIPVMLLGGIAALAAIVAGGQYAYDQPGDKHFVNKVLNDEASA